MSKVCFSSIHSLENEKEEINYSVDAKISENENYKSISYLEPSDESTNSVSCLVKYNNEEVHLYREGEMSSEFHFYKSGKSLGVYEIMNYVVDLNIELKDMYISDQMIKIDYLLMVDQTLSGNFLIKLEIKE